jgi:hypothetical protein
MRWQTVFQILDQDSSDAERFRTWHARSIEDDVLLAEIVQEEMERKGPYTVNSVFQCVADPGYGGRLIVGHHYSLIEVYADGCADVAYNFVDVATGQSLLNDAVDHEGLLDWIHLFQPVKAWRIQVMNQ